MIKKTLFLIALLLTSYSIWSQVDSSEVNLSPHGVIFNHLLYLQDDSYLPERAALSFPEDIENKEQLAIQLKKVLDGKGYFIDLNRLPKSNAYKDTSSNEYIYFLESDEPRIYVERIDSSWYYSQTTIELIPILFQEVYPFGTAITQHFHGPFWDLSILGLSVSKWLGLLALLLFTIVIFYTVSSLSKWLITRLLRQRLSVPERVNKDLAKVARSFALLVSVRILLFFLPIFQLPIRINATLIKLLGVLSIFFIILCLVKTFHIVFHYLESLAKKTENTLDDQLLPAARRIIDIIIWSIGIIYALDYLDVNVTALLAGISIGGLAIALAAQDTVKNFFGSIMIFIDRPFQVGDWINFDGVDGTVEEVGIRSTRIRSFANSVIYVPNGMLTNKVVNNMGLRQYRRFKTELGVTYDTTPEKIDLFVKGIRNIIEAHHTTRKDYFEVHLNSFGNSSINILLYCFFEASNWSEELVGRHEVMYAILLLAHDIGVKFAFPSQSLYIESIQSEISKEDSPEFSSQQALIDSLQKINTYFRSSRVGKRQDKIKPLGGE